MYTFKPPRQTPAIGQPVSPRYTTEAEARARLRMVLASLSQARRAEAEAWIEAGHGSAADAQEILLAGAPFPSGPLPCPVLPYLDAWRAFGRAAK